MDRSFQDKEAGEVHVYINSSTKCGVLDEASRIVLERVDVPRNSENVRRCVAAFHYSVNLNHCLEALTKYLLFIYAIERFATQFSS